MLKRIIQLFKNYNSIDHIHRHPEHGAMYLPSWVQGRIKNGWHQYVTFLVEVSAWRSI